MMKNIVKLTIAIILVLAGILLMLKEFGIINADIVKFWPAVLIIVGGVMFYEYFSDRNKPSDGFFG
ncbi:MAG: DUF5668 domain-containing protein [Candidatus Micrarchaeia archaeon]|jgi:hypothetical protein